jgi:aminoglycoside phosphotransferase (APT) family kinase protein
MAVSRMHAHEVETDVPLVRRLLAAQFPQWADLPIQRVEPAGTDNTIYRLGDDLVVRLPRRQQNTETLEKERRWLPRLAPLLPLQVPTPRAVGKPAEGYPFAWAVYRWLEGENATPERLSDPRQTAADLAELLGAFRRIPTNGPFSHPPESSRGVALGTRDDTTRSAVAALEGEIDAQAVSATWEAALRAPEWAGPPVWLHGDLDSRNLLATDGRLSGLLDFGCLTVGDPAADVMVAWKMLSAEAREIFRSSLSVDDATWARSRGWALSQALNALTYYTLETNAVLVLEARRWMAEVLERGWA